MIPYLVSQFAKSTLSNLVKESFGSDFPDIFSKTQVDYLFRYLSDLGAKSILLEFEYVDKDFLEDYSLYYVKRFSSDGNKCARLHFFSTEVMHSTIERALHYGNADNPRAQLQASYLGFIVVKPLPKTFIGKTCLKRYDSMLRSATKNCIARSYDVDLFGIKLQVESVAFQEQDKEVSACATTAIWAALHAMKSRNIRDIPACSEITINAINHIDGSSNHFPSKELSNKQILRALDVERLRNHLLKLENVSQQRFIECVKFHVDSGLPLILGADAYSVANGKKLQRLAGHAVTVVGYKEGNGGKEPALYIHDDRLGPFARATFVKLTDYHGSRRIKPQWGLELQRKDDSASWVPAHEVLVPTSLTIPTNRKVRLPYEFAYATCQFIQREYEMWSAKVAASKPNAGAMPSVSYSLQLREISEIRQDVIGYDFAHHGKETQKENVQKLEQQKVAFLTGSYARFQWQAEFTVNSEPALRIFFDATDIPQGKGVSAILELNVANSQLLLMRLRQISRVAISSTEVENFCTALLRHLKEPEADYAQYLTETFGGLRAPAYLKDREIEGGEVAQNANSRKYYGICHNTIEAELEQMLDADDPRTHLIWAVAHDGCLLIGLDLEGIGHPSLTAFKPARIAGELWRTPTGWQINSSSGRYSRDYPNSQKLLANALEKFQMIFYRSRDHITSITK